MTEPIQYEVKDVKGNVVIIRVAEPTEYDATQVSKGFIKAGAVMVIVAKHGEPIEVLDDAHLKNLGLKRIKQTWSEKFMAT